MTATRLASILWIGVIVAACGGDPGPVTPEVAPLAAEPELIHAPIEVAHRVRPGETFGEIAAAEGIPHADMQAMLTAAEPIQDLTKIRIDRVLQLRFDPDSDRLTGLAYPIVSFGDEWIVLHREPEESAFVAELYKVPYDAIASAETGAITESVSSFWAACEKLRMRDADIVGLAEIFRYDLDFNSQVRQGDQLAIWVEKLYLDGDDKNKYGHVLAARYINGGKVHEAIRFTPADGKSGYFTRDGMSTAKQFLRSPLKVMRVGSNFSRSRYHPILHKNRPHYGTDFSGPTGTPVHAIGSGRVTFAGRKSGYGNLVIIQHDKRYSTRYAHLSAFGKGIVAGSNVEQGQIIGKVGATGLATGPHLHFEFRVNGNAVDFMKQEFEHTQPISDADRPAFEAIRDQYLTELDAALPPPSPAPAPAEDGSSE